MENINLNKELGYYICDGKVFNSKIEACIYSTKNKKPIEWIFNNDVYENHDWSIEPVESIDYFYDLRSREIREKYDYVIISYSGGADSHNIVESFLRQNLHIDEIIVNVFEKSNKIYINDPKIRESWNYGAEYKLQIYPRLEEIKNKCPKTKITIVDMSDVIFDSLKKAGDASWIMEKRETLNVSGVTRYNYVWFKDIKKSFDKDKKIVLILGEGKPMNYIKDGNFYLVFIDKIANVITAQEHLTDHPNAKVELYYWHPESTKMIAKQSHMVKKWLTLNPSMKSIWTPKDRIEFDQNVKLYYHKLLRNIIYTTWNEDWYQANKGKAGWYDDIDEWFHKLYSDTREYKIWLEGINYVKENAKDYVYFDPNGVPQGLLGFNKIYKIGEID